MFVEGQARVGFESSFVFFLVEFCLSPSHPLANAFGEPVQVVMGLR